MDAIRTAVAAVTGYAPNENKHVFRLRGSIQDYDWGRKGSESIVAKFASEAVGPDYKVDPDHTYAEVRTISKTKFCVLPVKL
jgi:mannose-6-phosphate isomerase class I